VGDQRIEARPALDLEFFATGQWPYSMIPKNGRPFSGEIVLRGKRSSRDPQMTSRHDFLND
jgi:hypothetical protein